MIVGEAEVQGQVKRLHELALVEGVTGPVSNRLFRDALATGKRAQRNLGLALQRVGVLRGGAARSGLPGEPRREARAGGGRG